MGSIDYDNPEYYIGEFEKCYAAYSKDEDIRSGAASGGVVSTLLIFLLENGYIDGALVSKQRIADGKIVTESIIATTKEEILDCRTSIYSYFPLEKSFEKLLRFSGNLAVVMLPCQFRMMAKYMERYEEFQDRIKYKVALFCGGVAYEELLYRIIDKNHIDLNDVERIFYRKGHWRGNTVVRFNDGQEEQISYLKNWCSYKNSFFFSVKKMLLMSRPFRLYCRFLVWRYLA